jgi:antitoxin (DNA-binding transcriptional repressor) of toxin-antitoxin stability system
VAKVCWVRNYEFGMAFVAIDPEFTQQLASLWSALKAILSACLAKVKAGEELLVMERGKPIAKRVPVPKEIGKESTAVQLRELSRAGLVRVGTGKLPAGFWKMTRPRDKKTSRLRPCWPTAVRDDEVLGCVRTDSSLPVWWGSSVECLSAFACLRREAVLSETEEEQARVILRALQGSVTEIEPTPAVRVLRLHPLRAADALQLAASLVWCQGDPLQHGFVCLDQRLREAARREGVTVFPNRM